MSAPSSDPLATLLDMVRTAAREGCEQALASQRAVAPSPPVSLITKRELAHALGVSPATVDRLCRDGRIPFVRVGDVRRFDLVQVRAALAEGLPVQRSSSAAPPPKQTAIPGVRLLSRSCR